MKTASILKNRIPPLLAALAITASSTLADPVAEPPPVTGDPLPGVAGSIVTAIGLPSIDGSGACTVKCSGTGGAWVIGSFSDAAPRIERVRKGDATPGIAGGIFSNAKDPVVSESGDFAVLGTATGAGIAATNNDGIWWGSAAGAVSTLIAREGSPAPDTTGVFHSFVSVAVHNGGIAFTAKLRRDVGGIDATNDFGVWATDATGALHCVRRLGDSVTFRGQPGVITKLELLGPVAGSIGARHSHNDAGDIVRRVTIENPPSALRTRYRVVSLEK